MIYIRTHHHSSMFTYPMNCLFFSYDCSSAKNITNHLSSITTITIIIIIIRQIKVTFILLFLQYLSNSLCSFLSDLLCRCIYNTSIYTMISLFLSSHASTDTYDYYHHYNIYMCIYTYRCTTNLRLCTYIKKNSIRCKQS